MTNVPARLIILPSFFPISRGEMCIHGFLHLTSKVFICSFSAIIASMNHEAFRQYFYQSLTAHYLQGELQTLYHWCCAEIEGWDRLTAYRNGDLELDPQREKQWKEVIDRLKRQEPVQYIFQRASFMNLELRVTPDVLIPRPETEELVELVLRNHGIEQEEVLDVGTGSGCVALALKQYRPSWKVMACDASVEALNLAKENGGLLGIPVDWFLADITHPSERWNHKGIWVSNPPYIPRSEEALMDDRVIHYEPHMALFEPEPFHFIERIIELAAKAEAKGVYFETHATDVGTLIDTAKAKWSRQVEVVNDLSGKPRFLKLT